MGSFLGFPFYSICLYLFLCKSRWFCSWDSVYSCEISTRVLCPAQHCSGHSGTLVFPYAFYECLFQSFEELKNVFGILMGSPQKLQIAFGRMTVFTHSVDREFGGHFIFQCLLQVLHCLTAFSVDDFVSFSGLERAQAERGLVAC